jgi:mono/diheme cytochrome c family protein
MKKVLRIIGVLVGLLLLVVLSVAAWVGLTPMPSYESKSLPVVIPTDSSALEMGRKIVELECRHCHMGEDGKLSGRLFSRPDDPFGMIYSANITQHPGSRLSQYSDGELAYLFRTGIKKDGGWAPYMLMPNLSDEHMGAIIAYLRSDGPLVQPSPVAQPATQYSFLAEALIKFGLFAPKFYEIKPVKAPAATDKVAYGRYLAIGVYSCFKCHSASFETIDDLQPEKSAGFFGGGNPVDDEEHVTTISANITMSKKFGVGNWTEDQFIHAVQTGERHDGRILTPAMPRFGMLTRDEVSAIWAYLQTVPVLENDVAALSKK